MDVDEGRLVVGVLVVVVDNPRVVNESGIRIFVPSLTSSPLDPPEEESDCDQGASRLESISDGC